MFYPFSSSRLGLCLRNPKKNQWPSLFQPIKQNLAFFGSLLPIFAHCYDYCFDSGLWWKIYVLSTLTTRRRKSGGLRWNVVKHWIEMSLCVRFWSRVKNYVIHHAHSFSICNFADRILCVCLVQMLTACSILRFSVMIPWDFLMIFVLGRLPRAVSSVHIRSRLNSFI